MTIWLSSDHHFGHYNVISYCSRPYNSVQHMNEVLIGNWNTVVSPTDLVYYLGDFSLNANLVPEILPRLNGRKILIAGNHDRCFHRKDKNGRWREFYLRAGFEEVVQEMTIQIGGEAVLLSHFPYRNLEDPDQRYFEDRPIDRGGYLLHGHIHEKGKLRGRQLNVGCDVWNYSPVSLEEVSNTLGLI